ncbi:hypothetical protein KEM56_001747 [Ascosphaera pollenicola]|nr:hypothetical protein KEM56_001747 [Ascosphaera pollenicola]
MFPSAVLGIGESLRRRFCRQAFEDQHSPFVSRLCRSINSYRGSETSAEGCTSFEDDICDEAAGSRPYITKVPDNVIQARGEMTDHFRAARLQMMNQYLQRKIETRKNLVSCAESYAKALDPDFCRDLLRPLRQAQIWIDIFFRATFRKISQGSMQAEYNFQQAQSLEEIEMILLKFERQVKYHRRRERSAISAFLKELHKQLEQVPLEIGDEQWDRLIGSLYFIDNDGYYRPGNPIRPRQRNPVTISDSAPRLHLNLNAPNAPGQSSLGLGLSRNTSDLFGRSNNFLVELSAAIARRAHALARSDQEARPETIQWFRAQVADLLGVNMRERTHQPEIASSLPLRTVSQSVGQLNQGESNVGSQGTLRPVHT